MKKLLFLLVAVCSTFLVNAQKSKREEGIKIGIKGGLNVANVFGDVKDNDFRTSIHVGLLAEIIVSDKFSIQPELLYSGQGYLYTTPAYSNKLKLDYINLPVMCKFYLYKNSLAFEAGPQVGFLVSAKNSEKNTIIRDANKVDFGLGAGLNYELKSGVFFQGRYNLGLTNTNASSTFSYNYDRVANSVIQLSVGYLF